MAPIIDTLGRRIPKCEIAVDAESLVIQWGAERLWNWQPVGQLPSVAPAAKRGTTDAVSG
jgi:hypothetical protein